MFSDDEVWDGEHARDDVEQRGREAVKTSSDRAKANSQRGKVQDHSDRPHRTSGRVDQTQRGDQ